MRIVKPKDEGAAEDADSEYSKINAIVNTIAENTEPPTDVEDAYDENTAAMAAGSRRASASSSPVVASKKTNWRALGQANPHLTVVNVNHDDAKLLAATAGISFPKALIFVIERKKEGLEIDAIIEAYHVGA